MALLNRPRKDAALRGALLIAVAALALLAPAAAQARTITVGSLLTGEFGVGVTFLHPSVTLTNSALVNPEANSTSPVDGVVLRWRLGPQDAANAFALRVLHPAGGGAYTGAGSSVARFASTTSIQTFETNLPIRAGDLIGLDLLKSNPTIRAASVIGVKPIYWSPILADGATSSPSGSLLDLEFGFNAEVQPAPQTVLVSPSSGPVTGGTQVTISGSDFAGVTGVSFGSIPAASFVVNSESEITATAPAAAAAGPVDVRVTTVAGTTPVVVGDRFTYTPPPVTASSCVVPKLTGKKLKAARKALARAQCKLGKVTGKRGKAARVVKQSPKAGAVRAAGAAVNVKLGQPRA
jgi:hypothetical protein